MKDVCRGTNTSVGGTQGASGRGRKVTCPVCGRKVGLRPGRAGRIFPHKVALKEKSK